jgi:hypothetical protein
MPERACFSTVTMWPQRDFVPCQFELFAGLFAHKSRLESLLVGYLLCRSQPDPGSSLAEK